MTSIIVSSMRHDSLLCVCLFFSAEVGAKLRLANRKNRFVLTMKLHGWQTKVFSWISTILWYWLQIKILLVCSLWKKKLYIHDKLKSFLESRPHSDTEDGQIKILLVCSFFLLKLILYISRRHVKGKKPYCRPNNLPKVDGLQPLLVLLFF